MAQSAQPTSRSPSPAAAEVFSCENILQLQGLHGWLLAIEFHTTSRSAESIDSLRNLAANYTYGNCGPAVNAIVEAVKRSVAVTFDATLPQQTRAVLEQLEQQYAFLGRTVSPNHHLPRDATSPFTMRRQSSGGSSTIM